MSLRGMLTSIVMMLALDSCGGGESTTSPVTGPSTSNSVEVHDNFFSPAATTVAVGTTVTWTWHSAGAHDVSFTDNVHSATQSTGSFSRQFTAAGSYDYICSVHGAAMSGRVVVQ